MITGKFFCWMGRVNAFFKFLDVISQVSKKIQKMTTKDEECVQHLANVLNTYLSLKDSGYSKKLAFEDLQKSKKAMAFFEQHYSGQTLENSLNIIWKEISSSSSSAFSSSSMFDQTHSSSGRDPLLAMNSSPSINSFPNYQHPNQYTTSTFHQFHPAASSSHAERRMSDWHDGNQRRMVEPLVSQDIHSCLDSFVHDFDSNDSEEDETSPMEIFVKQMFNKRAACLAEADRDSQEEKTDKKVPNNSEKKKTTADKDQCRDYMIGCCRYENIRHLGKCKYKHEFRFQLPKDVTYSLTPVTNPAELNNVKKKFTDAFDLQVNQKVKVTSVQKITNEFLANMYEQRKKEIIKARGREKVSSEIPLFHGTSESALTSIFQEGIYIPSDYAPHASCSKGGKLSTSLCKTDCKRCVQKHVWNNCHMYGLGAYFATKSSKSDRYVSDMTGSKIHKTGRKMLLCKIFPGVAEVVDNNMKTKDERHDRILPSKGFDSVFVKGLGRSHSPGLGGMYLKFWKIWCLLFVFTVLNDEYIIFNRYQCLPQYLITYDLN